MSRTALPGHLRGGILMVFLSEWSWRIYCPLPPFWTQTTAHDSLQTNKSDLTCWGRGEGGRISKCTKQQTIITFLCFHMFPSSGISFISCLGKSNTAYSLLMKRMVLCYTISISQYWDIYTVTLVTVSTQTGTSSSPSKALPLVGVEWLWIGKRKANFANL